MTYPYPTALKRGDKNPSTPVPRPPKSPFHPTTTGSINQRWWPECQTITISFLNGTAGQRNKVKKIAPTWLLYAASLDFKFVDHIHGQIRIAFDDPPTKLKRPKGKVQCAPYSNMSWSYIGTDCLGALNTPETMHLSDITDDENCSAYEKTIILHEFGHALGLDFAPYQPAPGQKLPDSDWLAFVSEKSSDVEHWGWPGTQSDNFGWATTDIKAALLATPVDDELGPKSIMAFGWLNSEIDETDKIKIAKHYPLRAKTLAFGVQNRYDKSLTHYPNDMELYVLSEYNVLYSAIREVKKSGPKDKNYTENWHGWARIRNDVPPTTTQILVLDHPDRLEVYAVDRLSGTLYFDYRKKDSDDEWYYRDAETNPSPWHQWDHKVNRIRAVEVEGGYEVVFIDYNQGTKRHKLGHIFRKQGDEALPKEIHPIAGQDINRFTTARHGFGNKLYAASDKQVFTVGKKGQQWVLDSSDSPPELDCISDGKIITALAAGESAGILHYLVITDDGVLSHNVKKEGGWVSWDNSREQPGPKALTADATPSDAVLIDITAGVAFSDDKEDGYLQTFTLDNTGTIHFNRLGSDGEWLYDDAWNKTFDDSSKTFKPPRKARVKYSTTNSSGPYGGTTYGGINYGTDTAGGYGVPASGGYDSKPSGYDNQPADPPVQPSSSYGPPPQDPNDVPQSLFTKSAKCGDLEAFFIASGEDDTQADIDNNISSRGVIYRNQLKQKWNEEWKPYFWW